MEVEVNDQLENSQAELKISVTAEEVEPYLREAVKDLSKKHNIQGFRPGKVPVEVGVKQFGAEAVMSATLDKALPRWFVQAVLDKDLEALGRPTIAVEKADIDSGVVFIATVDVMPKIELAEADKLSAEKREIDWDESKVETELTQIAKMRSTFLEVTRPAEEGDTVKVDFEVKIDGQTIEGGTGEDHPVNLGEGNFLPEFEENLKGAKVGETRVFKMNFPTDYGEESLQGKESEVTATVKQVQKRVIPEINDEFAKKLGKFESLKDLKDKIGENMRLEASGKEEERLRGELAEKLAENSKIDSLPHSLIEREIDRRLQELTGYLQMQGKTIDDYAQGRGKNIEELRAELKAPAEKTVRVSLAIREFANQEKIEVEEKELKQEVEKYLETHLSGNEEERKQQLEKINEDELAEQIGNSLRHKKTLDRLVEKAQTTEPKKTKKEELAAT